MASYIRVLESSGRRVKMLDRKYLSQAGAHSGPYGKHLPMVFCSRTGNLVGCGCQDGSVTDVDTRRPLVNVSHMVPECAPACSDHFLSSIFTRRPELLSNTRLRSHLCCLFIKYYVIMCVSI